MAHGVTTALPIGDDRVVVAGWYDADRRGWLRVVSFRNPHAVTTFRQRLNPALLQRAVAAVRSVIHGVDDEHHRSGESPLEVLAAIPLDDATLRVATIDARAKVARSAADAPQQLRNLRDTALAAYPHGREEIKGLVDALTNMLEGVDTDQRREYFRDIYELFIKPRTFSSSPDRRNPQLQAALVRRLLTVETLRLWPQLFPGQEGIALLQNWVDRHLQHAEAFVRVDTLRTLSEVLMRLVRIRASGDARVIAEIFPGTQDSPPVTSAAWLLDALALFLYSHPPTQSSSECDASTWAAVSVVVNLVRLFPDSVMVICDHIAVFRANPLAFSILKSRLTSEKDEAIRRQLDRYLPWLERPRIDQVTRHCAPFLESAAQGLKQVKADLEMSDTDPDAA